MKTQMGICLALSLITTASAFASKEAGNGGGGFICSDPTKSEFLDLFEAQLSVGSGGLGLHIPTSNDPVENQIQNALNRLDPGSELYKAVTKTYAEVRTAKVNPTDPRVSIAWPADEKNQVTLTGCQPLGIMLYNDADNSILQDPQSLQSLPATQQAAAWVHETIYKFLRETQQDQDSVRARQIVGHLFSDEAAQDLGQALIGINPRRPQDGLPYPCALTSVQRRKHEHKHRESKQSHVPIRSRVDPGPKFWIGKSDPDLKGILRKE